MNKLTKYGVSALCGSLAAISAASAGEMSVSGGATVTYTQLSEGNTGNPLGMASGVGFSGSGELEQVGGIGKLLELRALETDEDNKYFVVWFENLWKNN